MITFKAFVGPAFALLAGAGLLGAAFADTLTVTRAGSGSGTVTSNDGAINCGVTCDVTYANGAPIALAAVPAGGSQFTGWLGPCTGTGACQFTIDGNTAALATFAPASLGLPRLDVDGTASRDALTDGLLIVRYLFGLSGAAMITGAVGPGGTKATATQIDDYLVNVRPALDIDGNGQADARTDGLLIIRYLFGLRGAGLIAGAVGPDAIRIAAPEIEAYLAMFFAATVTDPPIFFGTFVAPDRTLLLASPLPPMVGRPGFILLALPDGTFGSDPTARTPASAAAECAAVILACHKEGERNVPGCFENVPQCTTATPWIGDAPMCCAPGCAARYQEFRGAGESIPGAFAKAIFQAPSCMPGVIGRAP